MATIDGLSLGEPWSEEFVFDFEFDIAGSNHDLGTTPIMRPGYWKFTADTSDFSGGDPHIAWIDLEVPAIETLVYRMFTCPCGPQPDGPYTMVFVSTNVTPFPDGGVPCDSEDYNVFTTPDPLIEEVCICPRAPIVLWIKMAREDTDLLWAIKVHLHCQWVAPP